MFQSNRTYIAEQLESIGNAFSRPARYCLVAAAAGTLSTKGGLEAWELYQSSDYIEVAVGGGMGLVALSAAVVSLGSLQTAIHEQFYAQDVGLSIFDAPEGK